MSDINLKSEYELIDVELEAVSGGTSPPPSMSETVSGAGSTQTGSTGCSITIGEKRVVKTCEM